MNDQMNAQIKANMALAGRIDTLKEQLAQRTLSTKRSYRAICDDLHNVRELTKLYTSERNLLTDTLKRKKKELGFYEAFDIDQPMITYNNISNYSKDFEGM